MRALCAAMAITVCLGTPSFGRTGTPGPDYFVGSYDMVGRSGGAALLQSGPAVIVVQGRGVQIRRCGAPDVSLGFGPAFEIENLMSGRFEGTSGPITQVECLFHNNGYNRPILTCRADDGAAFTLWPVAETAVDC